MENRNNFTSKQIKYLDLIATGKTAKEIASLCDVSYRTVQNHVEIFLNKFKLQRKTELIVYWHRNRINFIKK